MNSISMALRPIVARDESATLVGQTMGFAVATAGAFALGAYLGFDWSSGCQPVWHSATLTRLLPSTARRAS